MNPSSSPPPTGPPRLLLGAAAMFWGGICGQPLIGLLLAIGIEACHWTKVRWDFSGTAFHNAWRASVLLIGIAALLNWLDGSRLAAVSRAFAWLPLLLFPLQFVQSYGMSRTMPLSTFSFYLRKRQKHAEEHRLPFREVNFSFGYVYLCATLLASSLGSYANTPVFFPGVAVLVLWAFHHHLRRARRVLPLAASVIVLLALVGGYSGAPVFSYIYQRLNSGYGHGLSPGHLRQSHTMIGSLGEIKQSPNIVWRLQRQQGPYPKLLRLASYNTYGNTSWTANLPPESSTIYDDFKELTLASDVEYPVRLVASNADEASVTRQDLPSFLLRGSLPKKGLLPIPGSSGSLLGVDVDSIEINSFGTIRVFPKHPVASIGVRWSPEFMTERPPWEDRNTAGEPTDPDLQIPKSEQADITRVAQELELHDGGLSEKIDKIRDHFLTHFTYTRYLDKRYPDEGADQRTNFVGLFLTETQRGHCEYFATASALLLREAGIPTRYCTGFSVSGTSKNEALIRGTDAHAWCRAWDAESESWLDVDLTPPDWTGKEQPTTPLWQGLIDRWQILREDLLIWRSQPGNLAIATAIIAVPLAIGALLIGRRLWRSRRRLDPVAVRRKVRPSQSSTPLSELEKPATRVLGPRPPGQTLSSWLSALEKQLAEPSQLKEAISLHARIRFDPTPPGPELSAELEQQVATLRASLERLPAAGGI